MLLARGELLHQVMGATAEMPQHFREFMKFGKFAQFRSFSREFPETIKLLTIDT
jgi:hypothetical protein